MEYKKIIELIREMDKTDLTKIELEQEGFRLYLEKTGKNTVLEVPAITPQFIGQPPAQAAVTQNQIVAETNLGEFQLEEEPGNRVLSPMVGTFYAAPSPEKPPFVKVGDKVKKGQTLCIIEAMKLMNEIESDYDGEVVKILVNNEQMVEFGQPLFIIQ
ncbi:MAG: acetyl-CoA carboxylase biotin carboxyl carrier protein [Clostridiales bacterium]|nr:acetyl-CoA carboxylase biotin carboxyl carrier protein [Clostridiales bacterium]